MNELSLDILRKPIQKLFSVLEVEVEQLVTNRLLEYQVVEHKKNLFSKTILYRIEPKSLDHFYQPLYIKKKNIGSDSEKISTSSILNIFKENNYITIIGNAGSGKSTLVKYLFINSIKENYKVPIKIELRYINDYNGSVIDYIYKEIFAFYKLGVSDVNIERLLNSGDFVFFFDGYDELRSDIIAQVTKDIDSFVTKYFSNKYVLTSRPYTNIDLLSLFSNYDVCALGLEEVIQFVEKQKLEKELNEKIITSIKNDMSKGSGGAYGSFLGNPLLLSMFILTFQSYSEVPTKRTDFYHQVFDTLFSMHDSVSKLGYVREKISGLSKEQFEEVLMRFSFLSYFSDKFVFNDRYLKSILNDIKKVKKNLVFENDKLIIDLQVAIGILSKEGMVYAFPHKSLQEYFTALYLVTISNEAKLILYAKLLSKIEKDLSYLISNRNFLTMLYELDSDFFIQELFIPLFQNILNVLKKEKELLLKEIYHYISAFRLLFSFMFSDYRGNVTHRFTSILYGFSIKLLKEHEKVEYSVNVWNNVYSPVEVDFKEEMFENKDILKNGLNSLRNIVEDGDKFMDNLKEEILSNKRSDFDMIDMIK